MRNFILVVNILALTLPFLAAEVQNQDPAAAEVQNQEQQACHGKDEILYDQKTVPQIPSLPVLNSNPYYDLSYYQQRASVAVSPYMLYPYFVKLLLLRPPIQMSKWHSLPNIPKPLRAPYPVPHPQFLAIPTNESQDKTAIPTISTTTPAEPTPAPTTEPVVSTVVSPEVSSVIGSNLETSAVPLPSPTL